MITIFTNQRTNGDTSGAPDAFAGGTGTFYVDFIGTHGTEVVTLKARPTGSSVPFKTIAEVFCNQANNPVNFQLIGAHDLIGVLTGADPTGATSPSTSNTNISAVVGE